MARDFYYDEPFRGRKKHDNKIVVPDTCRQLVHLRLNRFSENLTRPPVAREITWMYILHNIPRLCLFRILYISWSCLCI